jgi:hypothetical protein
MLDEDSQPPTTVSTIDATLPKMMCANHLGTWSAAVVLGIAAVAVFA